MDNNFVSAFAFDTGRLIEDLIKEQVNSLEERNQMLEAKILDWYVKTKDEKFAEQFEIKDLQAGNRNYSSIDRTGCHL